MNHLLAVHRISKAFSLFTLVTLLVLWPSYASAETTTLYVSPQGSDSWSGTAATRADNSVRGPFATIQRAQQEVRALKQGGGGPSPVTVYLRGGAYQLDEVVTFTAADSGSPEAPVLYANYPGEQPVISGGRKITGWQYYRDELWFVDLPDVKAGQWKFDQLFVEGRRRQRAKTPNEGFFQIEELLGGTDLLPGTDRFRYRAGDIDSNWTNPSDIKVVAYHLWLDVHLPVKEIDAANRVVTFQMETHYNLVENNQGARYVVENVFEALDKPGEWYLNRETGRLFYMPLEGETPSELEIFAPRLTEMVVFDGTPEGPVEHITLKGLTFQHNQWEPAEYPEGTGDASPAAITLHSGRNIQIDGCTFRNLGTYAVDILGGSRQNTISSNLMEYLGAGGIKIKGAASTQDPALRTTDNSIVNNTLHHLGELYSSSRGIFIMYAARNLVAHNEISFLRCIGIQMGYTWRYGEAATQDNVVEYNHIHDLGAMSGQIGDFGAIYTNGELPGGVIRNNLIHDIHGSYGAFGIYLDGYSSHLRVENNVVYKVLSSPFIQHFGRNNFAGNNVFALGAGSQVHLGTSWNSEGLRLERNIIIWDGEAPPLDGAVTGNHFSIDRNTYFRIDKGEVLFGKEDLGEWRERGHDIESVIADPMVQITAEGTVIDPASPALALGFQPIDLSMVGPRVSEKPPVPVYHSGDANADGQVNVGDIFYLINHLFADGPAPTGSGDANGDGTVSVGDVFYLIDLIFGQTSANASSTTASLTGSEGASIILGDPTMRGDEMIVPVRLDLRAETSISSLALGIQVPEGSQVESITIERSGGARSAPVLFEATPSTTNEAAWIVSFDEPVTILKDEPEVALIRLRFDRSESNAVMPSVTMNPRLTVVGVHSDSTSPNRPMPIPAVSRASR